MSDLDPNVTVSHEQDGRVLSGVGVTKESLAETMDARSVDDVTDSGAAPASGAPPVPADMTGQPKPTRGQARFSELTQKAKDAEAKAEAAEKRAADAEARLSQQPQASQPQPQSAPQPQPERQSEAPKPSRPEPTEDEVGVGLKYETYGAFVKDHHQWSWEQQQATIRDQIQQGIVGYQQQQAFSTHVDATRAKGRAAYKDFDAVMNGAGAAATNDMPMNAQQFIWQQPNAEHLVYAILRDPVLAQRLTWLSTTNPAAFGLELARLAPAAPAATPASTGNPGSVTPPAPMQPVGSGSSTTKLSSADAENFTEYQARRRAERGGSRRR